MKRFTNFVITAVIVLVGGYSALWFYQAYRLQNDLEQQFVEIEQESKPGIRFQYDAIKKSGYPFDIHLTLVNPSITSADSEQRAKIRMDGMIDDTFNLLGHLKAIEVVGKTHLFVSETEENPATEVLIEGKMKVQFASKHVKVKNLSVEKLSQFITQTDGINDCKLTFSPLKISSLSAGEKVLQLFSLDHAAIEFQRDIVSPDRQTILIATDCQGIEFQSFIAENEIGGLRDLFLHIYQAFHEKRGKTDFSANLKLELPDSKTLQKIGESPWILITEQVPYFSIDLNKFESSDNFVVNQVKGFLSIGEDAQKNVLMHSAIDSSWKNSKVYYDAIMEIINRLSSAAPNLNAINKELEDLRELLTTYLADLKAIIPKLYEFGTIEFKEAGAIEFNKMNLNGKAVLSTLELVSDLYGIRLSGDAEREGGTLSGKVNIDLIKYRDLIQDAVNYYNRLIVVLNLFKDETSTELNPMSLETEMKIFTYLNNISNMPHQELSDLKVTVSYQDGQTKVGTLNWQDFLAYTTELMTAIQGEINPESLPKEPSPSPATPR